MKPNEKKLAEIAAIFDRALEAGAIEKAGNWFSFAGEKLGQGRANAENALAGNAELLAKLEAAFGSPKPPAGADTAGDSGDTAPPLEIPGEEASGTAREAPSTGSGTSGASQAVGAQPAPPHTSELISIGLEQFLALKPEARDAAIVAVRTKQPTGRRRAGYAFTQEETLLPFVDLGQDKFEQCIADSLLIVAIRIPKPS